MFAMQRDTFSESGKLMYDEGKGMRVNCSMPHGGCSRIFNSMLMENIALEGRRGGHSS